MSRDILQKAKQYEQEIVNFLIDIIRIPSLSGREKDVVDRILDEMKITGFDEAKVDGLGSVIGRIGNGPKKIAFDAHIDTVDIGNKALWGFEPYDAHIRDGKIWGRGAADQKGGMASMVYAGKIIKELGLAKNATVYIVGSVMEEDCDGISWDYLIKKEGLKPDICVLTEPTGLNIYRGHRGRMEIKVSVAGRSCHGSAPERGESAVYKMARIVLEIEKLNKRLRHDDFLGKGTVVVSEFKSISPSLCAVPDGASIHLDRRLTAGETRETALSEIRELAGLGAEITVPVYSGRAYTGNEYPMKHYFPTWTVPEDSVGVITAKNVYRELFGSEAKIGKWTFSTNGVVIMGLNKVPCIGFGPGNEEQAHTANEWTPVEHLIKAAAFYAAFADKFSHS